MSKLIRAFAYTFVLSPLLALASPKAYVLDNQDGLVMPNTIGFIEQLSTELFDKTKFSLYVAVIDKTPESADSHITDSAKHNRSAYKDSLVKNLQSPYAVIVFMKNDKKIDIISSNKQEFFDEDKVYFEYMTPLLPKNKDEILSPERISAIVLNGYAEAADMIANHFGVTLQNNIPADESGGREFVKFCMYAMLLIMFGMIGIIYLRRNKS